MFFYIIFFNGSNDLSSQSEKLPLNPPYDVKNFDNISSGNIISYNNQKFNNKSVFIYYDNKHCVGVDFKQPFRMKGLVTVSNKNTITEISQAMYRLRGLNIGHTLTFYFPENIKDLKSPVNPRLK